MLAKVESCSVRPSFAATGYQPGGRGKSLGAGPSHHVVNAKQKWKVKRKGLHSWSPEASVVLACLQVIIMCVSGDFMYMIFAMTAVVDAVMDYRALLPTVPNQDTSRRPRSAY